MAYTGTLQPKIARDATSPGSRGPASTSSSEVADAGGQGSFAFYLLLLFTFIMLGRPQDFIPFLRPIPIALIVGLPAILLTMLGLFNGRTKFRKSRELNLVLALTVWFVLGIPFADWRSNSVEMLRNEWIKTVMIFFLLTQTVTTLQRIRYLLWVIFLSGFVATGLSLMLGGGLMQNEDVRFMGLTHGFFSGNFLGIAAGVTLPFMAAILVHTRSILKQLILVASFGTMVYLAVLTASRSNMICITVSLALVWAIVLRDSTKARVIGILFVLGLVASVAVAPRAFWERVGTLWDTESYATTTTAGSADASTSQRKGLLWRSINVSLSKPLFGLGIGNFPSYSFRITNIGQEWKGTHNTFTQISSEAGLPALALYVALLITVIGAMRGIVRKCKGKDEFDQIRALASATTVSILAFTVGGFFAHLAYEHYLYYLAGIGVALQTVFAIELSSLAKNPDKEDGKQNGHGWRRFRKAVREARA